MTLRRCHIARQISAPTAMQVRAARPGNAQSRMIGSILITRLPAGEKSTPSWLPIVRRWVHNPSSRQGARIQTA